MKRASSINHWGAAVICAFAGAAVFQFYGNANRGYIDSASLFYWWGFQWVNPASETQHGWLILGLSAWLWWRNLKAESLALRAKSAGDGIVDSQPSALDCRAAAVAMLGGLALHALGFAAQQARVSILALLIFTWGVLRLAGGRRWGAAALFPLAFMIFAIPINALDSIGFWLRVWVVNASRAIAHASGIGVLQSGTQLVAPDGAYNYDVAAACSGIRSLTAIAALSLLAGYLNFHAWWRRGLVLLLCFPLVYLGNVARIVSIIFAAQLGGPKAGDIAHDVMGYGVFVIVLGGVLGAVALLRRFSADARDGARPPASDHEAISRATARRLTADASARKPHLAAVAVVTVAIAEMLFLHRLATSPIAARVGIALASDGKNPVDLPSFIGTEWIGRRAEVTAIERDILPPDTGFSRKSYVSLGPPAHEVFLSVVLSGRDRTSIHRPELCLVGQGWTITSATSHVFKYPGGVAANNVPATILHVQREVRTARGKKTVPDLVAYWFVGGDAVVATHWARISRDAWNRVAHARADRWAYVLVQTNAEDGEAAALARMQAVLDATLPVFQPAKPVARSGEARAVAAPR